MAITLTSTTDTPEQVQAALGKTETVAQETDSKVAAEKSASDATEKSVAKKKDESDPSKTAAEPKKNGFKKRIDKLNKRNDALASRVEYLESELTKRTVAPKEEVKPVPKTEANGRPKAEDFAKHEDFVEALTDWKTDQKLAAEKLKAKEVEVKSEFQKAVDGYSAKSAEFAKKTSDFHDVLEDVDDISMSVTVRDAILDSEDGPALAYALAKDKEEYKRICSLPPPQAARAIGRFEAKLAPAAAPKTKVEEVKPKPAPPNPVGSKIVGTKSPDEMTYKEYKQWWAETHPHG